MTHIPVLQKEILKYLDVKPNENFIDATVGETGHTVSVLEKNKPEGKVLGIELDPEIFYKKLLKLDIERLILVNDSFVNLKEIVDRKKFERIQGILFDIGMSSWHLEESSRGFSFQKDEPLDMRYRTARFPPSPESGYDLTAEKIVNKWPEEEIKRILREYGEERFAKSISRKIIEERKRQPIKTTLQLVEIIKKATPGWYQHRKINPATKTFQALRIAVNDELNNLKKVLPQALEILEKEGRIVVISFHSLEDRIVKNFFKTEAKNNLLKILTKKPVRPDKEEITRNPRSRSAKLRAAIKL